MKETKAEHTVSVAKALILATRLLIQPMPQVKAIRLLTRLAPQAEAIRRLIPQAHQETSATRLPIRHKAVNSVTGRSLRPACAPNGVKASSRLLF